MVYIKDCIANLTAINSDKSERGLTLLELLIVMLVLGVLTGVALPNLVAQVGKAREVEAKQNLSAIAFAQQAYHFENRTFANTYSETGLTFSSTNYDYSPPISSNSVTISDAIPKNLGNDNYRTYSVGIYYNNGVFSVILCQARDPVTTTQAPNSESGNCSNGGIIIQ
ncbi:type IV pilin protein [Synechocystis sp. CACIAM 05]|uniref:type IV pilin protein n=1 Tax=Synechocystis sp. CACIAM 05 TaxID=1933929 RepID=UPI00138E8200|nr:type IV pilin-like G/H family protein [Synechocystis sp. CACIAM 05]QHU99769.1 hypothetical protein BWK47_06215 [Synechocystis sp. CACIAM 05]